MLLKLSGGSMKVLVCGGRQFNNVAYLTKVLNDIYKHYGKDLCIIQGGATGADALAKSWAKNLGLCNIQVDANWDYYANNAGFIRNKWMITFCNPEITIAFKGGNGTANMVKQSILNSIPTYTF